MADGYVTPVQTDGWWDGRRFHSVGTLTVAAGNYATGGIVLNFNLAGVKSSRPPIDVTIHGQAGFIYSYIPGASIQLGLMMIFVENTVGTNSPLVQHSVTAIVSGVTGDTINYHAIFTIR